MNRKSFCSSFDVEGKRTACQPLTQNEEERVIRECLLEEIRKALESHFSFSHQELVQLGGKLILSSPQFQEALDRRARGWDEGICESSFHSSGLKVHLLWLDCSVKKEPRPSRIG